MKRTMALILCVLAVAPSAMGAMTYSASRIISPTYTSYIGSGTTMDPVYQFANEAEGYLEATTAFPSLLLTSTDTPPTATEGMMYYDTSEHIVKVRRAADWLALGSGSFTGGSITGDIVMANGIYLQSSEVTAEASAIQAWDTTATASYTNVLSWTNGAVPAIVLGAATSTVAIASTGLNVTTAGIVSGITNFTGAGTFSINDNATTNTTSIGGGTTTGTVTVGGTGTQAIDIGNGVGIKTVALGSSNTTSATTILGGDNGVNINVDNLNNPTNINTSGSTGTVTIGGTGTQTISIGNGAGAKAVNLGSVNGGSATVISSGSADLDINATAALDIDAGTTLDILAGGAFSIDGANAASNISLATNTDADDFTIGLTGATNSSLILNSTGTGTDAIGLVTTAGGITTTSAGTYTATAVGAVALFSNAIEQTITLGNETGASSLNLKAGTGNVNIQGVAATTITVGDAAQEGTMKFGESSAAMELDIGTGAGVHTIHLGDGAGAQVLTVGSTNGAAQTTIQSGTGDLSITSTDDWTATAAGTVSLFANAVEQLVTIGNETGASSLALKAGTGNINIQGVPASTITIGDAAQTAAITIGASTDTMTDLSLGTGVGAHTIHIGDGGTAAQVITIGSTSAASATTIQGGSVGVATKSPLNAGAVVAGTCTAVEYQNNGHHRTVLTLLTGTHVHVADGGDGDGIKIYDFPQGNVIVLGAFADAVITADAHMTGAYACAIGTVVAGNDNALSSTEADFVASTAVTQGSNQDFHGVSALAAAGLVGIPFDGTGGGKGVYFNAAAADGSTDAEALVTAQSGTIVIEWIYLGDF